MSEFMQRRLFKEVKNETEDAITKVSASTLPWKNVIIALLHRFYQTTDRMMMVYRPHQFVILNDTFVNMVWSFETNDWEVYVAFQPYSKSIDIAPSINTSVRALMESLPVAVKADFRFNMVSDCFHELINHGYRLIEPPEVVDGQHVGIWHNSGNAIGVFISKAILEELNSDPACLRIKQLFANNIPEEE